MPLPTSAPFLFTTATPTGNISHYSSKPDFTNRPPVPLFAAAPNQHTVNKPSRHYPLAEKNSVIVEPLDTVAEEFISQVKSVHTRRLAADAKIANQMLEETVTEVGNVISGMLDAQEKDMSRLNACHKREWEGNADECIKSGKRAKAGYEQFHSTLHNLLGSLEKNNAQIQRAQKEFEKDMFHIRQQQKVQVGRLLAYAEKEMQTIIASAASIHKAVGETKSLTNQLKSLFNL